MSHDDMREWSLHRIRTIATFLGSGGILKNRVLVEVEEQRINPETFNYLCPARVLNVEGISNLGGGMAKMFFGGTSILGLKSFWTQQI